MVYHRDRRPSEARQASYCPRKESQTDQKRPDRLHRKWATQRQAKSRSCWPFLCLAHPKPAATVQKSAHHGVTSNSTAASSRRTVLLPEYLVADSAGRRCPEGALAGASWPAVRSRPGISHACWTTSASSDNRDTQRHWPDRSSTSAATRHTSPTAVSISGWL